MLGEIKSDQFFLRIYAQLSEDTDNTDTDECTDDCDSNCDQDADDLSSKELGLTENKTIPACC